MVHIVFNFTLSDRLGTSGRTNSGVLREDSHSDRCESMEGNVRTLMCVGKDRDVQGEFLLLDTLYREHHCIGGLIHNSQYVLPLHILFGVSCIYAGFFFCFPFPEVQMRNKCALLLFHELPKSTAARKVPGRNPVSLCSR